MPDSTPSDDELLSAHLDGELTVDERTRLDERLAGDPVLRRRRSELQAASELAAVAPRPLPVDDRDRLISAALAASATSRAVTDLGAARQRRGVWRTRLVTVAAGVAALAIAVPVLRSLDSGADTDVADSAPATADAAEADDVDAGGEAAAPADEVMMESAGADMADDGLTALEAGDREASVDADLSPPSGFDPLDDDLGLFDTESDLEATVVELYERAAASEVAAAEAMAGDDAGTVEDTTDFGDGATAPAPLDTVGNVGNVAKTLLDEFGCPEAFEGLAGIDLPATVVAADFATAEVAGRPAGVGLFVLADGPTALLVVDLETCTVSPPRLF